MSFKLKVFLGVLVLIAVFSVFQISTSLVGIAKNNTANIFSQTGNSIRNGIVPTAKELDSESLHDGLNDPDETDYDTDAFNPDTDGDGFLDGEEILSGYDPLEKNQAVEIQAKKDSQNLTTSYMQTMLGGLLAGDISLDPNDPTANFLGLDVLSNTVLEGIASKNIKTSSTVLLVVDSSPEEIKTYLTKVTKLLNLIPKQDSFLRTWDPETKKSSAESIKMALLFEMVARNFSDMEVPQQFAGWHKETTITLVKASGLYKSLAYVQSDPILGIAQLELMPDIMTALVTSGAKLNDMLKKESIDLSVTFYETAEN